VSEEWPASRTVRQRCNHGELTRARRQPTRNAQSKALARIDEALLDGAKAPSTSQVPDSGRDAQR